MKHSPRQLSDAKAFGKVAVLYGGSSSERAISLKSGAAVLASLQKSSVDAVGIDAGRDVVAHLVAENIERCFIALHGRGGEDGTLQGALEVAGIPYTGSGVLASALAMDKWRAKTICEARGIPTPASRCLDSEEVLPAVAEVLGFPLAIKPIHEGSSIGVARVDSLEEMQLAWHAARELDSAVLAERWVEGTEYTVALLDGEALPVIRLEMRGAFYDYHAKYDDDAGTRYHCPSGLSAAEEEAMQQLALEAADTLAMAGWGRADFFRDANGQNWFLELNTTPGMTAHSLVPMAARVAGMDFDRLVWRLLESSL